MCNKRVPKVAYPHRAIFAPLAQRLERLVYTQRVGSSNLSGSIWPLRLSARTGPSQGSKSSSILLVAKKNFERML